MRRKRKNAKPKKPRENVIENADFFHSYNSSAFMLHHSSFILMNRPLRVFPSTGSGHRLCHSSVDKPAALKGDELCQKLRAEPWIQPWLDEEELYPGQDWNMEIEKAVEASVGNSHA